jgi:hypothetical protein
MFNTVASDPDHGPRQCSNRQEKPTNRKTFSGERKGRRGRKKTPHGDRKENLFKVPQTGKNEFDGNNRAKVRTVCECARTPSHFEKEDTSKSNRTHQDKNQPKLTSHPKFVAPLPGLINLVSSIWFHQSLRQQWLQLTLEFVILTLDGEKKAIVPLLGWALSI